MVVVIDTREQKPLKFSLDSILTATRRDTLAVGDYGCEFIDGSRPPLYFERKNLNDLFGTMTKGHKRFKKEIERAKDLQVQLVLIIEGTLRDVYNGIQHSKFEGHSCVQKLFTLWMRYDLYPVFMPSRLEMAAYIKESYMAVGREWVKKQK